ncbi:MAG: glycosyltransferase family 4 protein [Frankiales bacterium]|nr:glycosyltransferase family 4 protein [Frankiales bacterium]
MAEKRLTVALVLAASTGGIGRHVADLAGRLVARGHQVMVCGPPEADPASWEGLGRRFVAGPESPAAVRLLRRVTAEADVVHAHGLRATCTAAAVRPPLVSTWHNAPPGSTSPARRTAHGLAERFAARRATVTLTASADLAERARRAGSRRASFLPVVAPALPPAGTPPEVVRAGLELGDRCLVLAVARLAPQKRLDLLVDATRGWADDPLAPCVVVAGDGPAELRASLEAAARQRRSGVRFLGARTDISDLLGAADAVVLPSDWEARPFVLQEALRAGVPVVATDVGGVAALVGSAGVLVPPGDAGRLGRELRELLDDPQRQLALSRAGRERAAGWLDPEQMVDAIEAVYLDLK